MPHNDSKKHQPEHHPHPSVEHVHPTPHDGHVHDDPTQGGHSGSSSHPHPTRDRDSMHGHH